MTAASSLARLPVLRDGRIVYACRECEREATTAGLCNRHYLRWYRTGTVELKGREG